MKAVFCRTAVHVSFEIRLGCGCSLLRMDGNPALVHADEDGVMIFGVFINETFLYKTIDNLSVNQPFVHEIAVHSAHIRMLFGKDERLFRFDLLWRSLSDHLCIHTFTEQTADRFGIG